MKLLVVFILVLFGCDALSNETTDTVKDDFKTQSSYTYTRKITDDILANTLKAEYPSDKFKVVLIDDVCTPPAPCEKKIPETTEKLHEKLKYECPPCRKCVKEINKITALRYDITAYREEIYRLKAKLEDANEKLELEQDKQPNTTVIEKIVTNDKNNYIYFSPVYAQDGIIATDKNGTMIYEAAPVESVLVGGGYTRFFEVSNGLDIGLGAGGYVGQTGFGINAQIGIKF